MKSPLPILVPALLAPLALYARTEPARPGQEAESGPRSLIAIVPEDAIFFAAVSDLAGLRAAAAKNAWGRMLAGEELAPLWESLWAKIEAEAPGDGTFSPADARLLWDSLRGGLAVFLADEDDADDPAFGLALDPGEGRARFEEFLAQVDDEDDSEDSYEEYAGVTLAIDQSEERPNAEFEVDGVWCAAKAATREHLLATAHGMIDRLRGSGEASIAESALLGAARSGAAAGRIELFADLERVVATLQQGEDVDEDGRRVIDLIGLPDLSWAHGTLDLGESEELDLHLRMALPEGGYLADWLAAFGPLPGHLAALGPAGSIQAAFYNIDLFAIYESIWDLVADVDRAVYEEARAGFESGLQAVGGLDPEGDFLAQLTGEFAGFSVPVPKEEFEFINQALQQVGGEEIPEPLRAGEVYVIGLEDAAVVELFLEETLNTVGGMLGLSAASIESEDFQGFLVQSLELPMGMGLHWCFTDDYVAGSLFPSALRSVLALHGKEDAPSLLKNDLFAPHIEQHARASMLGLVPSANLVRGTLVGLGWINGMAAMAPDAAWDNTDGSDLTAWPFAGLELPDGSLADGYLRGTVIFKIERSAEAIEFAMMTR